MLEIVDPNYFMLKCNYIVPGLTNEHWLIEILNGSSFFFRKHPIAERFFVPAKQDHGEPDAVTSTYSVDFKLLISQEYMAAMNKNKPDIDYSHMKQGYIIVKTHEAISKKPATNFLADIAQVTKENIEQNSFQSDSIRSLIKNLEKAKNLFLYYPYEFHDAIKHSGIDFERALTAIFTTVLSYRMKVQPKFDSFVCIKANTDFLIYEWDGYALIYRDKVSEFLCANYMDAKKYSLY